jgi:hypothetical protein
MPPHVQASSRTRRPPTADRRRASRTCAEHGGAPGHSTRERSSSSGTSTLGLRLPDRRVNLTLRIENRRSMPKNNGENDCFVSWLSCYQLMRAGCPLRAGLDAGSGAINKTRGATVHWVSGAAALLMLSSVVVPWWLVRREAARWRRFRQTQGEPEVVARMVASRGQRSKGPPLRLLVFSTRRSEPAGDGGSRRQSSRQDPERARPAQRRPRGNATMSCWPAIVLML